MEKVDDGNSPGRHLEEDTPILRCRQLDRCGQPRRDLEHQRAGSQVRMGPSDVHEGVRVPVGAHSPGNVGGKVRLLQERELRLRDLEPQRLPHLRLQVQPDVLNSAQGDCGWGDREDALPGEELMEVQEIELDTAGSIGRRSQ
jgi:hypothetical protein